MNVNNNWQQLGQDIDGEAAGDWSGYSVSLSADGARVAIGARSNHGNNEYDSGQVRLYAYNNIHSTWQQLGQDIDGVIGSYFGSSVSLSADGTKIVGGALHYDIIWPFNHHYGLANVHQIDEVLDMEDINVDTSSIIIYPNPTSNILAIQSETIIKEIKVYNSLGQLMITNKNQVNIDISTLSNGMFFVKIIDENNITSLKKVLKN